MAEGKAWAINADAGAPAYAANEARRILAALLLQGQSDRVGAREGIRPGSTAVSLSSTTVTVHRHAGVVYPGLTSASGPYPYEMAEGTHTLDPADASNDRIDAIDIQIQDDDEDASGQRRVRSVYVVGTPGSTPSEPSLTSNAFRASTIDVPADGTGSPSLTYVAPWTVASGGIVPVRDTTELPSAGEYDGLMAWQEDEQFLLANISGTFTNIRHEEVRGVNEVTGAVSIPSSNEGSILTVDLTIPSHWNSWDVEWRYTFTFQSNSATSNRTLTLRVRHGGLSGDLLSPAHDDTVTTTPANGLRSVTGGASALTGTGSQQIRLTGQLGTADDYDARLRIGHARAIRVS